MSRPDAATVSRAFQSREHDVKKLAMFCCLLPLAMGQVAWPQEDAAIRAEGLRWAEYYQAEDLDGLMTLYVDDVVVALHGQPALFGKESVREYFAARLGTADTTFELNYEVVEVHGDIAYIISQYWLRAVNKESGDLFKDAGRSMLVYKKGEDGRWRIAADLDQATPDVGWPSPSGLN